MRISHVDGAICSESTIKIIALIDQQYFGESDYLKYNCPGYYVAINAWLYLARDTGNDKVIVPLLTYMKNKGLVSAIRLASTTADYLISVANHTNDTCVDHDIIALESLLSADLRMNLQFLRFLKRFTPKCDALLKNAAEQFLKIQDRLNWRKHYDQSNTADPDTTPLPPYDYDVLRRMKRYFDDALRYWEAYYDSNPFGYFSNGSCADSKCLADKISCLAKYESHYGGGLYPYYPTDVVEHNVEEFVAKVLDVIPVPKNYKQGRLIAPEPAYVNYHANRLKDAIEASIRCWEHGWLVDVKDGQRLQRDRAYLSSLTGVGCTIDSSNASDSESRYNMRFLLSDRLWKTISRWLPKKYKVDGKQVTASTFLTSGNPCTFPLEKLFFVSAGFCGRDIHWEHTGEWGFKPSAFGDDLIVDSCYIEETLMVLERLGIKVNYEKTFVSGNYRESCGVEYLSGEPMKSIYWPRTTVLTGREPAPTDYASLVSLQHRTYEFRNCCDFLSKFVGSTWPATTFSEPGMPGGEFESTDLWGVSLNSKRKNRPCGAYWREDYKPTEYKPEYGYLEGHTQVHVKPLKRDVSTLDERRRTAMTEMYQYIQWLKSGPVFASDYDREWGITSPRSETGVYGPASESVKIMY